MNSKKAQELTLNARTVGEYTKTINTITDRANEGFNFAIFSYLRDYTKAKLVENGFTIHGYEGSKVQVNWAKED